jgi:hypothetical protein
MGHYGVGTGLAAIAWEATWSGRSSQGQVSLHGVAIMTQGGRRAHGTIATTKGRAITRNGI